MIEGKVWGTTEKVWSGSNTEMHRIVIKSGGYCSKHYHKYKFNLFYVESGKLKIDLYKKDSNLIDSTILYAGDQNIVAPNEYHRFTALEDTIAYEIYWTELSEIDINREDVGGIK